MKNVVLYIAASLDGFIARPDGNMDWLNSIPNPQKGDYGYASLLESIQTIIMGKSTYNAVIDFGIEWPYTGFITYIVTGNKEFKLSSPDTYVLHSDINEFVTHLKKTTEKDIWLVGGGQLITYFINNELVDKLILTVVPVILGEGIALFPNKPKETNWALLNTQQFNTGLVTLTYSKK